MAVTSAARQRATPASSVMASLGAVNTMRPASTQTTSSAIFSKSEVMWVDMRMPRSPSAMKSRSRLSTSSRAMGSSPAVASSSTSSSGLCESAKASVSFMPMPRESSLTFFFGARLKRSHKAANWAASHSR